MIKIQIPSEMKSVSDLFERKPNETDDSMVESQDNKKPQQNHKPHHF